MKSSRAATSQLPFIELFAGVGLVRLGLERAGWRCVLANDIDPKKEEMYRLAFPAKAQEDDHFLRKDIWKLLEDEEFEFPSANLVTVSFPCIDLSLAGNRGGLSGEHSSAFWALPKLIERLDPKPQALLVENVVGFATSRGGKDFSDAAAALSQAGYVLDAFVVDARHFTAQSRPRLFMLGLTPELAARAMILEDSTSPFSDWLRLYESASQLRPTVLMKAIRGSVGSRWGFVRAPKLPKGGQRLPDVVERLPENSDLWWGAEKVEKLVSQMSPRHLAVLEEMKAAPSPKFGTVYRRKRSTGTMAELRTDGFAGCLRTPRGGSSKQILVEACNGAVRIRWMTPREYARLQGAPDSFPLPENRTQALFGFGDAVCVPVLEWIGRNILNPAFASASVEAPLSA